MAVVTTKSTLVTNADAKPLLFSYPNIARGKLHQSIGYAPVANGDSIGSRYELVRIRSGDRLSGLTLYCTAIPSAAANIGLYETLANGDGVANGVSGNASLFATAQSIATALNGLNVTYAAVALTNSEKRIWELLGLTADPGKDYVIALTLTAAATAAGTVLMHVTSVSGE